MENITVILLIGQSNGLGCGDSKKAPRPINAFEYLDTDEIIPMREFLELSRGNGTIAQSFSVKWSREVGEKICFIQSTVDGSLIKNWGHDRYNYLVDAMNKYKRALEKLGKIYNINKKYAIWIQGESDGKYGTDPVYYKRNLIKLGDKLKEEGIDKTFVSISGYWKGTNYLRSEVIMAAQESAILSSDNLALGSFKGPSYLDRNMLIDDVHYNQEALNELGGDIGERIIKYHQIEEIHNNFSDLSIEEAREIFKNLEKVIVY